MNVIAEVAERIGDKVIEEGLKEGGAHVANIAHHCIAETGKQVASGAASLAMTHGAVHLAACGACTKGVIALKLGVGLKAAATAVAFAHPFVAIPVAIGAIAGLGYSLYKASEKF